MKKILLGILILLLVFIGILLMNTFTFKSKQIQYPAISKIAIEDSVVGRFSEVIQIPTISYDDASKIDSSAFRRIHKFIESKYPLCNLKLKKQIINKFSLVFEWEGQDKSLSPALLLAHLDVVPVSGKWGEEPFSGKIKDNYIWGRGTLDDKVSVFGILEAVESLLQQNFTPQRSIILAFGHDEETMGKNGASQINLWLKEKGIRAEFILDEGLLITEGIVPGLNPPAALIGIAEKGMLTLKLSTDIEGGHSSMPKNETAINVLSNGISRLQQHPFKPRFTTPAKEFLNHIGPEMPFFKRIVFANSWLFESLIIKEYEKTPAGNALVRTTIAPVIFISGYKDNVIPKHAEAVINLRPLPEEDNTKLIEEIKSILNDERIKLEVVTSLKSSEVSSIHSKGFSILTKTIKEVFPDVIVAPSLMIAGTDSKHYADLSSNIYRFLPIRLKKDDLSKIHGQDEKISVDGYKDVVRFYHQLLKNI
jgi:carboxypeptidase PM20D1